MDQHKYATSFVHRLHRSAWKKTLQWTKSVAVGHVHLVFYHGPQGVGSSTFAARLSSLLSTQKFVVKNLEDMQTSCASVIDWLSTTTTATDAAYIYDHNHTYISDTVVTERLTALLHHVIGNGARTRQLIVIVGQENVYKNKHICKFFKYASSISTGLRKAPCSASLHIHQIPLYLPKFDSDIKFICKCIHECPDIAALGVPMHRVKSTFARCMNCVKHTIQLLKMNAGRSQQQFVVPIDKSRPGVVTHSIFDICNSVVLKPAKKWEDVRSVLRNTTEAPTNIINWIDHNIHVHTDDTDYIDPFDEEEPMEKDVNIFTVEYLTHMAECDELMMLVPNYTLHMHGTVNRRVEAVAQGVWLAASVFVNGKDTSSNRVSKYMYMYTPYMGNIAQLYSDGAAYIKHIKPEILNGYAPESVHDDVYTVSCRLRSRNKVISKEANKLVSDVDPAVAKRVQTIL